MKKEKEKKEVVNLTLRHEDYHHFHLLLLWNPKFNFGCNRYCPPFRYLPLIFTYFDEEKIHCIVKLYYKLSSVWKGKSFRLLICEEKIFTLGRAHKLKVLAS